jgi:hypothetical protein
VVVEQAERADVTGRLLELGELDVGVAGLAPQQDHAARPGGDPRRAVHVGQAGRPLAVAAVLALVVQGDDLDPVGEGELEGVVDAGADVVLHEVEGDVFQRVEHDRAGAVLPGHLGQQCRVRPQVVGKRAAPHHEMLAEDGPVGRRGHPGHGAADLLGPVGRDVEDPPGLGRHRPAQHRSLQSDPRQDQLLNQRRLPNARRADNQQALPRRPCDIALVAPQDRHIDRAVEQERPAVDDAPLTARLISGFGRDAPGQRQTARPVRCRLEFPCQSQ